jgi:hypothetical protein
MNPATLRLSQRLLALPTALPLRSSGKLRPGAHARPDEERDAPSGTFADLLEAPSAIGAVGSPLNPREPPPPEIAAPSTASQVQASSALQDLWPVLVRRVAWEGDGERGAMRLELGAGALSGATLVLRCDAGRIHVALSDPTGADLEGWRARIGARLLAAGVELEGVD